MKLLFKQKIFSWLDSFDVFDVTGEVVYSVKGKLSWGHCVKIYDKYGEELGTIKQRLLTWLPKFDIYYKDSFIGSISKEFTFLKPRYNIDFKGWSVNGNFFEWDYTIEDSSGATIATVSKELFNWSDTYSIEVENPNDALTALMLVVAIDAEKCSRDN